MTGEIAAAAGLLVVLVGVGAFVLIGLAVVGGLIYWVTRLRLPSPRPPTRRRGLYLPPFALDADGPFEPEQLISPQALTVLADAVGYAPQDDTAFRLDIQRTVAATARRGGELTLVHRACDELYRVHVLASTATPLSEVLDVHKQLVHGLRQRAVDARLHQWHGDLDRLWCPDDQRRSGLSELLEGAQRSCIVVVGDPASVRNADEAGRLLAAFDRAAWVQTRHPIHKTEESLHLQRWLPVVYPDAKGWERLGRIFGGGQLPPLEQPARVPGCTALALDAESRPWNVSLEPLDPGQAHGLDMYLSASIPWACALASCSVQVSVSYAFEVLRHLRDQAGEYEEWGYHGFVENLAAITPWDLDRICTVPGTTLQREHLQFSAPVAAYLTHEVLRKRWPRVFRDLQEFHLGSALRLDQLPDTLASVEQRAVCSVMRWQLHVDYLNSGESGNVRETSQETIRLVEELRDLGADASPVRAWVDAQIRGQWQGKDGDSRAVNASPTALRTYRERLAVEQLFAGDVTLGSWALRAARRMTQNGLRVLGTSARWTLARARASAIWCRERLESMSDRLPSPGEATGGLWSWVKEVAFATARGAISVVKSPLVLVEKILDTIGLFIDVADNGLFFTILFGLSILTIVVGVVLFLQFRDSISIAAFEEPAGGPTEDRHYTSDTSHGMEFIELEGGQFSLGPDSEPLLRVAVDSFWIASTEVTRAEYAAVMGDEETTGLEGGTGEYPVAGVSWCDALKFLNRLSTLEDLPTAYSIQGDCEFVEWDKASTGYRLPTSAEWEYAAKAGTTTLFSFGDELQRLSSHGCYKGNCYVDPDDPGYRPVARFRANPWGLYDVHGNVWEWVWASYYEPSGGEKTSRWKLKTARNYEEPAPRGLSVNASDHVARGGSWLSEASSCVSSSLVQVPASELTKGETQHRLHSVGFRAARTSENSGMQGRSSFEEP